MVITTNVNVFNFKGQVGYVYREYLQNNPITLKYTTPYEMNLRLTPNGKILKVVEGGQTFNATIHSENYNWYRINVDGTIGFVYTAK